MGLSEIHRHLVITGLQVAAMIVMCYIENASGSTNIAQGCVGSRLDLQCPSTKIIRVTSVQLGISGCIGIRCCIQDSDCYRRPSEKHRKSVSDSCEGQKNCTIEIESHNQNHCETGWWLSRRTNIKPTFDGHAFERITYSCAEIFDSGNRTLQNFIVQSNVNSTDSYVFVTPNDTNVFESDSNSDEEQQNTKADNSATSVIVVVCVVCLFAIIAIGASVTIFMIRRKKKRQVKPSVAVKTSVIETDSKEASGMNLAQEASLNENAGSAIPIRSNDNSTEVEASSNIGTKNFETTSSDYCELKVVATGRMQSDSQYEQLDHRSNFEPLIIYEELQEMSAI